MKKDLLIAFEKAAKKIAPVWPLESFVAVNPYMGISNQRFDEAAETLAELGGIQMTLSNDFYLKKINEGLIKREDIQSALKNVSSEAQDVDQFIKNLSNTVNVELSSETYQTFIDVASFQTRIDWNRFTLNRISNWAASYFDQGQAMWKSTAVSSGLFSAWKKEAGIDLNPEIEGLAGYRNEAKELSNDYLTAAEQAIDTLGLKEEHLEKYLHRLLLKHGGWAAYVAKLDWDNGLKGSDSHLLIEFLSILVCQESLVYRCLNNENLSFKWNYTKRNNLSGINNGDDSKILSQNLILQEAFDQAAQRELIDTFKNKSKTAHTIIGRKKVQAVFCIDVRSEVFRRNFESQSKDIETLGFAGFFGFPVNFMPLGQEEGEAQCPVLIAPGPSIKESNENNLAEKRKLSSGLQGLWKTFKTGAVSCFSFVSPIGIFYLPKLFSDSFGITKPTANFSFSKIKNNGSKNSKIVLDKEQKDGLSTGLSLEEKTSMAKNALTAMSLTKGFAKFVMIVGHGSKSINNPHAAGLDCGACGGKSGEINAKVAAGVLNDKDVRIQLAKEGINIPSDTLFLACLHNTTTDEISIFNEEDLLNDQLADFEFLKENIAKASHATRAERALRMPIEKEADREIFKRSNDWSQIRPEWGLAGCSSFIIGDREKTKDCNLSGKSFLHSYDWKQDKEFKVLESIMTAPMIVTSWINLQYFASTVDNNTYGSGNKTLHNVTAGIGVLEGYSGDLRVGLPMQSIHDGENFQHEPLRLKVVIEAPIEAINNILEKHPNVKDLCDNKWIYLMTLNENGEIDHRYEGNLSWSAVE